MLELICRYSYVTIAVFHPGVSTLSCILNFEAGKLNYVLQYAKRVQPGSLAVGLPLGFRRNLSSYFEPQRDGCSFCLLRHVAHVAHIGDFTCNRWEGTDIQVS
jgi:hypothetical protein